MKLAPAQLAKHLQGGLAPVYIVSGDDPLLCQEAADAIRSAARQQGFDERQVFSADASFDWGTLLQAGASMSLFAEKRLLELRLPSGKPGDKGAAALIEYCSRPAEDTLLLVSLPKLDGSAQKTKWGKALVEGPQTQFVQIWPVDANQLPQWIRQRLSQAGLSASQDAVELIAARVEGNLLAAAQEVEKLKLMAEEGQITVETVQAAVADSARFDVFGLVDAVLNGDAAHALRMLEGLRGEGVEPPVILWALARELRVLANIALQYSQGIPLGRSDGLLLRGEVGFTAAPSRDGIPQDYLFRAGGSNSVRGYAYQSLGVQEGSATLGGRYLLTLSAEYTHWFDARWGVATFFDAGQAGDDHEVFKLAPGYGMGARWKSPAGPLAVDLAWGQLDKQLRVHFSLAVPF